MKGNVFIIGLGLIGGSVGLAIKDHHRDATIVGYDVNKKMSSYLNCSASLTMIPNPSKKVLRALI